MKSTKEVAEKLKLSAQTIVKYKKNNEDLKEGIHFKLEQLNTGHLKVLWTKKGIKALIKIREGKYEKPILPFIYEYTNDGDFTYLKIVESSLSITVQIAQARLSHLHPPRIYALGDLNKYELIGRLEGYKIRNSWYRCSYNKAMKLFK